MDRSSDPVTRNSLLEDIKKLGIIPGKDLWVHSALSRIGRPEGGANTIIDVLRAAIGPDATLIMPAYPMSVSMFDHMRDPSPFDMIHSPSRMGALTEIFRKIPEALRSAHPTHSIAALGPSAALYTSSHHKSPQLCGPGSPFDIQAQRGGYILALGTGVGKITAYHWIEDHMGHFPLRVHLPERMAKEVIFPDGHSETIEIEIADPKLSPWRIDNFQPKETEILAVLEMEMEYSRVLPPSYGLIPDIVKGLFTLVPESMAVRETRNPFYPF